VTSKIVLAAFVAAAMSALVIVAQAPSPAAKFDVASIRPCQQRARGGRGGDGSARPASSPGRLNLDCLPVRLLVFEAYVRDPKSRFAFLLPIEGPAWIDSERYQISAVAENKASIEIMQGPMLRALLEDRFQAKTHRETREGPAYILSLARGGSKLKPFKEGTCIAPEAAASPATPFPPDQQRPKGWTGGQLHCGALLSRIYGPNRLMDIYGINMEQFAKMLGPWLGRPVVDKSGLKGLFEFHLEYASDETLPDTLAPALETNEPRGPSIFTAVQEQLGLRLDSGRGPGEFLVIDRIERPTPN
jgi:uncharacterized protein (TIGR03435 family)